MMFGGIGTLAETSELQRSSFNRAFAHHGLDWCWERETYRQMLGVSGGVARIMDYAAQQANTALNLEQARAIHREKTRLMQAELAKGGLAMRDGVEELVYACRQRNIPVAIASTTDRDSILRILAATGLSADLFALIMDRSSVDQAKPSPEVYQRAAASLGVRAADCIAIEDSAPGLAAAVAAGVPCVVTPGANTVGQDYALASAVLDSAYALIEQPALAMHG